MTQSCDMDCLNCKYEDCIRPEERCTARYPSWDWEYRKKNQAENLKAARKRHYERNKAAGLCVNCSTPAVMGKTLCVKCAAKKREQDKKKRMKKIIQEGKYTRQEKKELGMCTRKDCTAPAIKGKSLCREHYEEQREICRNAGKTNRGRTKRKTEFTEC